jgi:hypothetical protein
MFGNQKGASDTSSPTRTRQRRNGRGLGPFTSGHLTIIVVTVLIVVAFPFAAFAVTGSNVFVTDATSGVRAKVDSKQNLQSAIHDATSGVGAKVDASGKLTVGDGSGSLTVDGTVNDRPALPSKPIVILPQIASSSGTTIYGPVSKPFAIGSLTLTEGCGNLGFFFLYSVTSPGGTAHLETVAVPALQTVQLTFPIPLVTTPPAGGTASLQAQGADCVIVSGVGYQS